jgi:hypothetical protein
MAIKAQHMNLKLGEVPLVSIDRLFGGQSSFRLGSWVREYLRWFLWGARAAWTRPRSTQPIRVRVPFYYRSQH